MSTKIVTADIGGTHARFALAEISGGMVLRLDAPLTLRVDRFVSFEKAWQEFTCSLEHKPPRAAAIALATTISGEELQMTNNPWIIRPGELNERLGIDRHVLINDFGAVAHAVANLDDDEFAHLCGPNIALPEHGMISVIGPGTGLGVACLLRAGDHYHVVETEGGHAEFAPLDATEESILGRLRARHGRVSTERVVSGPGLWAIYDALAASKAEVVKRIPDADLWQRALDGADELAAAALDRFCLSFGTVAGDIVLAHGARALVIAGGLAQRSADRIRQSGFSRRMGTKGRFRELMESIPVKLLTHAQPGLYGAAAAFAQSFSE